MLKDTCFQEFYAANRHLMQYQHDPLDCKVCSVAEAWLLWNEHLDQYAEKRYRINDFHELFADVCRAIDHPEATCNLVGKLAPRRAKNFRGKSTLHWGDIRSVDPELARRLHAKADEYGFDYDCFQEFGDGSGTNTWLGEGSDAMQFNALDVVHTQGVPGQECNAAQHDAAWNCNDGLVWEWAKEGLDLLQDADVKPVAKMAPARYRYARGRPVVRGEPVTSRRSQSLTPMAARSPEQAGRMVLQKSLRPRVRASRKVPQVAVVGEVVTPRRSVAQDEVAAVDEEEEEQEALQPEDEGGDDMRGQTLGNVIQGHVIDQHDVVGQVVGVE